VSGRLAGRVHESGNGDASSGARGPRAPADGQPARARCDRGGHPGNRVGDRHPGVSPPPPSGNGIVRPRTGPASGRRRAPARRGSPAPPAINTAPAPEIPAGPPVPAGHTFRIGLRAALTRFLTACENLDWDVANRAPACVASMASSHSDRWHQRSPRRHGDTETTRRGSDG
jgi:hypothetical protein